MNKLTIPVILSIVVMIAGVYAFMPVEQASTVHTQVGPITILSLEKTLDSGTGDDVTWTLTADTDLVVLGINHDNTPTLREGLCTDKERHNPGSLSAVNIHCGHSSYRVLDLEIAGSQWAANKFPHQDSHLALNEWPLTTDNLPLEAGDTITMTFDTENSSNDVILDVIFAIKGTASLS